MSNDSYCNRVYFSALLPEVSPIAYKGVVSILEKYDVPYSLLKGTKDIWCRDYMPVQIYGDHFVAFGYNPDYLNDTAEHKASITDTMEVCRLNGITRVHDCRDVILDGGNVVRGESKIIMTSKVFEENPGWRVNQLSQYLERKLLGEIIFIPWDMEEVYGHTDGIVRFIDDDKVLMTNYWDFDEDYANRFFDCMKHHFKSIKELRYKVKEPNKNNWAYVNWLQTDKVLILPKFEIPEDEQAFRQIEKLMPSYKGRIEMVDARDLVCHEGCFNCCSWTIREENRYELPKLI